MPCTRRQIRTRPKGYIYIYIFNFKIVFGISALNLFKFGTEIDKIIEFKKPAIYRMLTWVAYIVATRVVLRNVIGAKLQISPV